jgi:hypothetical protein
MDFIARIGGSRKGGGSWPTGFIVWRDYDAQNLSSDVPIASAVRVMRANG